MSKAGEWAKREERERARAAQALDRPAFHMLAIAGQRPYSYSVCVANVSGEPCLQIDGTARIGPDEALAIARWIVDTFGEPAEEAR